MHAAANGIQEIDLFRNTGAGYRFVSEIQIPTCVKQLALQLGTVKEYINNS